MPERIGSWEEFKAVVGNVSRGNVSLLYRGHSDASWPLTSTWHRRAPTGSLEAYWRLLDRVHDVISTWVDRRWDLNNAHDVASFVGFLQHNGFPTPLLDWTRSPYIAAFFAFEGVDDSYPKSDSVSVFIFDGLTFAREWQQVYDPFSTAPHVSVLETFSRGNQKQIIQQGMYTFSNIVDQGSHLRALQSRNLPDGSISGTYLIEFQMPVKEKPVAMRELRLMGISAMSLFPSLEGVCRSLRDEHFAATEMGQTPSERIDEMLKRLKDETPLPPQVELPLDGTDDDLREDPLGSVL